MASASSESNVAKASRSSALRLAVGIGLALSAIATPQSSAAQQVTAPPLRLGRALTLSDQVPDFDRVAKSRIVRLSNGMLVVAYLDAVENDPGKYVYDLKADVERPARDIFMRTCNGDNDDCTNLSNWTSAINLSNTASESSIQTDWSGDTDGSTERTPFHGDSAKPNIFGSGSGVVVTWVDKYCPSAEPGQPTPQRTITYRERNIREIPFSCVYVAHAAGGDIANGNWTVDRLTDGSRDAKQDVNRGMKNGAWAVIWQEDPRGLQPGEAEGPGDGASGAHVSFGTDIWYTFSPTGRLGNWAAPVALTDNQSTFGITSGLGGLNPINNAAGEPIDLSPEAEEIANGATGASRPMLGLVKGTAIVAFEETKGSGGGEGDGGQGSGGHDGEDGGHDGEDGSCNGGEGGGGNPGEPGGGHPGEDDGCGDGEDDGGHDGEDDGGRPDEAAGKFVRYIAFPFNAPPTRAPGCIVSDPQENGRRVRLVAQSTPGPESDLRWAILWRQGIDGQGAPADIMLRRGTTDFDHNNLFPAVDSGCETSDIVAAGALDNDPPLNVSSNTYMATDANLADTTGANSVENARAHRALLRGDDLYVGYTYTEDDALAQLRLPRANYNFWMRHFDAVAGSWTSPKNLSLIYNWNVDAKEPRLMGTPGDGPSCPTVPEECQDTSIFFAAWGTEWKDPVTGAAVDLDIFITYTTDKGADFVPAIRIARGDNVNNLAEDQLRSTPDGSWVFSVWNQQDRAGAVDTRFTIGRMERRNDEPGGPQ